MSHLTGQAYAFLLVPVATKVCTWKALEHLFVQLCGSTGSDEIRGNFRRGAVLCTKWEWASVTQKGFSNSMHSDYFALFVFKSDRLDVAFLVVHSL